MGHCAHRQDTSQVPKRRAPADEGAYQHQAQENDQVVAVEQSPQTRLARVLRRSVQLSIRRSRTRESWVTLTPHRHSRGMVLLVPSSPAERVNRTSALPCQVCQPTDERRPVRTRGWIVSLARCLHGVPNV